MDDLKPIIYTIFIVIYFLFRIFRKAKKSDQPAPETVQPPVEKKSESLFDVIREEIKKQQELAKAPQESRQPLPIPQKKVFKAATKKPIPVQTLYSAGEPALDSIEKEGTSAFDKKRKRALTLENKEESKAFEFNPREAFRMKTLLERHPLV